jgi:hypothetical protein
MQSKDLHPAKQPQTLFIKEFPTPFPPALFGYDQFTLQVRKQNKGIKIRLFRTL